MSKLRRAALEELAPARVLIDVALVRRLISTQFPEWAHLAVEPVPFDGWDNRTFRLGEEMSVRLPSALGYAQQVEKEHRWLPRLGPLLPLPVPVPLTLGVPSEGYPFHWSVNRWLPGEDASRAGIEDVAEFASDLAGFLSVLHGIDGAGGPSPGKHNYFRGASPKVYEAETYDALEQLADGCGGALGSELGSEALRAVWSAATAIPWQGCPGWLHGDLSASNLLVDHGRLSAVIDFGCSGVGDPACDLTIAWTFFAGASRESFRTALCADEATWTRARGWALWKALIVLADQVEGETEKAISARRVIHDVLEEHEQRTSR